MISVSGTGASPALLVAVAGTREGGLFSAQPFAAVITQASQH